MGQRLITVLLADDHPLILRGLSDLLAAQAGVRVVGEESDACKVVEAVTRLRPDVLVLDLIMPGMSGMDIIRHVSKVLPNTRIVVLSMHANVAYVWEALRNGALGYVLKCAEGEALIHAVRAAGVGRRYLSPPLSESELDDYAHKLRQQGLSPHELLTKRERQVLRMVAEGSTSAQIAEQLHIGIRTVETYRASILLKLGLRNKTELVRHAIALGIISPV